MAYRVDKLASFIKEEVSLIFLHKLNDPAFGLVTVTSVKLSPDLRNAKIYFSVFEKDKREVILEKINDRKNQIRTELAQRLQIKRVPEISFFIDDTLDYVEKIESLFKKIHENDNEEER